MVSKKLPPSPLDLLGGKKEPEKSKVDKKRPNGAKFKKLKSGGYHVQHYDEQDLPIQGEEHAVADVDGLHDHLEEHFGDPKKAETVAPTPVAQTTGRLIDVGKVKK
jgi:hypothetical protein